MSLSPFQVSCPSCSAEYPVDPDRVPPGGIHAVCSACLRTFPVTVPEEEWATAEPLPLPGGSAPASEREPSFESDPASQVVEWSEPPELEESPTSTASTETVREEMDPDVEQPRETGTDFVWEALDRPSASEAPAEVEEEVVEEEDDSIHDLSNLATEALAEVDDEADRPPERGGLSLGAARFGRRDPHDRAKRLARVLVSDIIAYYPEKHAEALLRGTVKEDFAEEVEKSRKEYVDQVGREMADSTPYFREALNEVLARGGHVY
jgi:predicted Zn finger-like uncharacterized protein